MRKSTLLPIVAMVLAACAGGSQPTGGSTPSGPIKIGLITSLTGNYAPLGTNDKLAAELMRDTINKKGGINGRQIDLTIMDDQSKADQTIIAYSQMVDQGIVAIEGPPQSTAELALIPQVDIKKIPDVSVGASDDQVIPVHPYVFQTTPTSKQVAMACLKFMKEQGWTKLAMLYDTKNAYAVKGHTETQQLMGQYGVNLVDDESFETTQTDFTPQFSKILAAKPDIFLTWATGAPPVIITKQWKASGTSIPLMMTAAEAAPQYVSGAGAAAEGVYVEVSLGVIGASLPAGNKFKKLIDDFASPFQSANTYYPPQFAWDSMLAMTFIFDAIKRKGSAPSQIQAGLESINLDTPEGHYTFNKDKHWGMPDSSSLMGQIKNGQFVPVGNTDLAKAGQ